MEVCTNEKSNGDEGNYNNKEHNKNLTYMQYYKQHKNSATAMSY